MDDGWWKDFVWFVNKVAGVVRGAVTSVGRGRGRGVETSGGAVAHGSFFAVARGGMLKVVDGGRRVVADGGRRNSGRTGDSFELGNYVIESTIAEELVNEEIDVNLRGERGVIIGGGEGSARFSSIILFS